MTSNNNQILSPSNIWSHFIAGRLNPSTNIMPWLPPNWTFPFLPINKQQFETLPNPYSSETIQMFRSMLNRRNQIQQNVMHQNMMSKNSCVPPMFGAQKNMDFFLTKSPGSSNIMSPIDQGFGSLGESSSNFENIDCQKSDINSSRCPVCNQMIVEFDMETHLHQELKALIQNSRYYKEENSIKQNSNSSPSNNEAELGFDVTNNSSQFSQDSRQISLNRYKNFEKIKFNRHQRKNNLLHHQKSLDDNAGERGQYLPKAIRAKSYKTNLSECNNSSAKKLKISEDSDNIDMMK